MGLTDGQMACVTCARWIPKDMQLSVFYIHDPVILNPSLGVQFIFNFAVMS
jgi:hypothetical protein